MTFSIVMPARNGEKFLRFAIDSAINQTRPADEIILIDDSSDDETARIVKEYGEKITYFLNPRPTGFVDAWNRAITKAGCDFVTILHQDDILHPEYLDHIEKALKQYPMVRHLYTACNYIDEVGKIIRTAELPHTSEPVLYAGREYAQNYLNGVIRNNHIHRCPGVTTSRELLLRECSYRKEAGHIADDDFFLRVGAFTDVVGISQPFAYFRNHRHSETGKLDSLTHRLAMDYLFQVQNYKDGSPLLDKAAILKIRRQAVRFINLLLFQSIRDGKRDWTVEAFKLRKELECLLPGFMEPELPVWGKLLWKLTTADGPNLLAPAYVLAIDRLIKSRDSLKRTIY